MTDSPPRRVVPAAGPLDATVRVPGSKSLTNRALVCAALAAGRSVLDGALFADDTEAMTVALRALGAGVEADAAAARLVVTGTGGALAAGPLDLDMRQSGTTSRFLLPVVALGAGRYRVDGSPQLRARPMGPVLDALGALGARVEPEGPPGHLPVTVVAPGGLGGGTVRVAADTSSQFLSGLLLSAPYAGGGLRLEVTTAVVSAPYVDMTLGVMAAFGVAAERVGATTLVVPPGRYAARDQAVEPDASAASYPLAAAALCGGRVTVPGLGAGSVQGDARFAELLGAMGARVDRTPDATTVEGTGTLRGLGEVDLSAMPDMAPTLAAVAVFADGPTRVRGVGFIRGHETDRIAAVVTELRRCGIDAREEPDGFTVRPGRPHPARIETYDDHRMAMSFALLGLRVPGIEIADPGCVVKTFPTFWTMLDALSGAGEGRGAGAQ